MLSLVFAQGKRPDADAIVSSGRAGDRHGAFEISHRPAADEGWIELLSNGLTFDCAGLAPAGSEPMPAAGALMGLTTIPEGEVVSLRPGPHIAAGRGMLPVVRVLAGIASRISVLPGVLAVSWLPAGSWMETGYFRRVVDEWLDGGAFPALGLTSLRRESNGAMVSVGLELLIGQELRFEPERSLSASAVARMSVRLMHELITFGPLTAPKEFPGTAGEVLVAVPVRDGTQLRVMVGR